MTVGRASRTPKLEEVLSRTIQYRLEDLHVCIPAEVTAYDAATQKASVKPLVQRVLVDLDGNESLEGFPVIPSVPVMWPRAGGFFMVMPLAVGDLVMLVFADRSLDLWLIGSGSETNPIDLRTHDLSDAVAIPGLYPFSKALNAEDAATRNMVLGEAGGPQVHIGNGQVNLFEASASQPVALGDDTDARISALQAKLDGLIAKYNTHTHTVATTGTAASQTGTASTTTSIETNVGALASVGSQKVRSS